MNTAVAETTEQLHFTIDAEWLMGVVRSLWADEGEPEKALRILEAAFLPALPSSDLIAILIGEKKLTGDSTVGMELEDDNQTHSTYGDPPKRNNPLNMESRFTPLRNRIAELEYLAAFALGKTEKISSPHGLIEVPRMALEKRGVQKRWCLKKGIDLEDIPYREIPTMWSTAGKSTKDAVKEEKEPQEEKKPPPKAERSITTNTGWLSPEGKFYPCQYRGHATLALQLGFEEIHLENLNWVKVQSGDLVWDYDYPRTQAQIDAVFDWCQAKGKKMPTLFLRDT